MKVPAPIFACRSFRIFYRSFHAGNRLSCHIRHMAVVSFPEGAMGVE